MPSLKPVSSLDAAVASGHWDAIVAVAPTSNFKDLPAIEAAIAPARTVDLRLETNVTLVFSPELPGQRLVFAPTGALSRDYDDVRRFGDAAKQGLTRAREAGAIRPLLLVRGVPAKGDFTRALEVALLEGVGGLWEPLEGREALGSLSAEPIEEVGFIPLSGDGAATARIVGALEAGRRAARDIAGTEPERMTPIGPSSTQANCSTEQT